jgi:hypothetical protein
VFSLLLRLDVRTRLTPGIKTKRYSDSNHTVCATNLLIDEGEGLPRCLHLTADLFGGGQYTKSVFPENLANISFGVALL